MEDKVAKAIESLKRNGFDVWFVNNKAEASQLFWDSIFYEINPSTASWGDSLTLNTLEIIPKLRQLEGVQLIETFGEQLSWREQINNRKTALSCDMFLTGTNAITTKGQLVNLDMIGNRIAGIAFGPRKVVVFLGINKIVETIDEAMTRVKSKAAPMNAVRHTDLKTPCQKTGKCMDCNSPHRICNLWLITEKAYPLGRIKIIIIDEQLGF
jgi:L-lactate utilization protein LutB